ncbi:MAG: hypothetical protein GWN99_00950 [Gemmatimonadetes bacterium]|uniref:Phospholipid/glycerol acyltransferase domain-containing protein n=1 Tax=Candidatus Kutchimonas denitrificans TaxID=3056748 RepID=A0AAE4ZC33_9BACT|nr:hypothetical protein [Gemmatimonadota bacterium]NIR75656.1 hypothetical protein [Candidatus Kutchimonas denitrificans]NIR99635.1 hypothetical protein [Gemmatimonadota bacterium]NIT65910.1 hypothetical protein [Gemmatimonadota bacterium]NIV22079.1 hypothetical protein [Gemmatimonadota bacterium]
MLYRVLRGFWRIALTVFFRDIEVEGRGHVPDRGALLIVPNHTNALVDPLVILTRLERPVTVTAKTTLARNPLLAVLMRALNVITFQRRQDVDADSDSDHNARAFEECRRRLKSDAAICIFPEGVSHSDPGLRPFRSGAARIALDFVEHEADRDGLLIQPVGLYFEKKDRFRSSVWVRFGEPFDVAEWLDARREAGAGEDRALAAELTAEIEARVRELTLNFETRGDVELYTWAAEVVATGGREPQALGREEATRLGRRVDWIKALQAGHRELRHRRPQEIAALEGRLREYRGELRALGITPAEVYLPMSAGRAAFFVLRELELVLIGLPVALWGALNHLVPYQLTRVIARKMSTDEDHFASNAVFIALPAFPLFYLIQIAAAVWLMPLWLAALYAVSLPYSGAVTLYYRDRVGSIWQRTSAFLRLLLKPGLQDRLAVEGRAIIGEVERLGRELG